MQKAKSLFSVGQITTAAVLGGPFAGAWLMAGNYRQLGEPKRATKALILGFIFTDLILAAVWWGGNIAPIFLFPLLYGATYHIAAEVNQGKAIRAAKEDGYTSASLIKWLPITVIGLAVFTVIYLFIPEMDQMEPYREDHVIRVGTLQHEVRFDEEITMDEATQIGKALEEANHFGNAFQTYVRVEAVGKRYVVYVPAERDYWNDPTLVSHLQSVDAALKANSELDIELKLIEE